MSPTIVLCVGISKLFPYVCIFSILLTNSILGLISVVFCMFQFEKLSIYKPTALQTKTHYILYMLFKQNSLASDSIAPQLARRNNETLRLNEFICLYKLGSYMKNISCRANHVQLTIPYVLHFRPKKVISILTT
jgi:hypothetical protein